MAVSVYRYLSVCLVLLEEPTNSLLCDMHVVSDGEVDYTRRWPGARPCWWRGVVTKSRLYHD